MSIDLYGLQKLARMWPSQMRAKWKRGQLTRERRCGICGGYIRETDDATVDHIIATADGGKDNRDNWQLAHALCNQRKSSEKHKKHIASIRAEADAKAKAEAEYVAWFEGAGHRYARRSPQAQHPAPAPT